MANDFSQYNWAEWLEGTLKELVQFNPTKIAIVAVDANHNTMTGYHECSAFDLYGMSGMLSSDAMWSQIEANADRFKAMLEMGGEDDGTDSEG